MEASTVSITLWGDGLIKGNWLNWYHDIGIIFQELGYKRTHIGIDSKSYSNSQIVTIARKEKAILDILQSGETPESMSCYSLIKDYKVAMFDFDVMAVRQSEYMSIIFNRSDLVKIDVDNVIFNLTQYMELQCGEVYQMDRKEVPLMYAVRAKPVKPFKSLIILKKF